MLADRIREVVYRENDYMVAYAHPPIGAAVPG
jgi:hypothetical protein